MEYSYPLSTDWTTDEMVDVVRFFEVVEMAYEKGAKRELVMARYKRFKEIVPSQAEEKQFAVNLNRRALMYRTVL